MAKHSVDDIRNVALVGHGGIGKTSLADALLFHAKVVDRKGSVDDGSSISDFDEEEKKRKYSIDTSVLHLDYKGKRVHLLDTPGYPDFVGAGLTALEAVETAVVVVAASAGIQVNTRRMFKEATKRELARFLVINKLDTDNVQFEELLASLRGTFGKGCVLFNAPNGLGAKLTGVVSLLDTPAGGGDAPVDLAAARSQLIDAVVESDEALMEKYLMEGTVSADELTAALPRALASGSCIPIFCTSVKKDVGVGELLDAIVAFAPSPVQGRQRVAHQKTGDTIKDVALEPKPEAPFRAQVFKTLNDKFVGNLSFLRVFSGKITADQSLVNERTGKSSRNSGLLLLQGKSQQTVPEAVAGDIVAVAKVEDLHIGDTVGTAADHTSLPKLVFPTPMFGLAVEPKARGDEQKISGSLAKIADEDPTFHVNRDAQTKEMVITGMSSLHLDVIQARLKRRFELEVVTHDPKIPYRETIMAKGEGQHRHRKQSGGRGQFGEVHLRVYPMPREINTKEKFFEQFAIKANFEKVRVDNCRYEADHNFGFIDTVVGGTIPNQFVPACEKGCKELLERGALAGYRLQDVAVEIYFGKDHPVDSSEQAFKTAARIAFKNAFLAAHPVLLEPIVDLEVTVPSSVTGALLGYLNTKRGRIENQDSLPGDLAVIKAKAPLAELTRLAAELQSMTGGQAAYSMEFSHYDVVPGNVQQQIVAKSKMAVDEEE